jgi:hypothetical protein
LAGVDQRVVIARARFVAASTNVRVREREANLGQRVAAIDGVLDQLNGRIRHDKVGVYSSLGLTAKCEEQQKPYACRKKQKKTISVRFYPFLSERSSYLLASLE